MTVLALVAMFSLTALLWETDDRVVQAASGDFQRSGHQIANGYTAALVSILGTKMEEFSYEDFVLDTAASLKISPSQVSLLSYGPTLVEEVIVIEILFIDRAAGVDSLVLGKEFVSGVTSSSTTQLPPLTDNYKVNTAFLDDTIQAPGWALAVNDISGNGTAGGGSSGLSGLPRRNPFMGFWGMVGVIGFMMFLTIAYAVYFMAAGRHDTAVLEYTTVGDPYRNSTGCSTWVLGQNRTVQEAMKQGQLSGALKSDDSIKCVACGAGHMVIVSESKGVYVAGDNYNGQLGLGHNRHVPNFELNPYFQGVEIETVVCGARHTAIITSDGELYTFGAGEDGVLGHGDWEDCWVPTRVEYFDENPVKGIASGDHHMIILASDGLYTQGWNAYGQLMVGDFESRCSPEWVEYFSGYENLIREMCCGTTHSLILCGDWEVYGCGGNSCGQLGLGHYEDIASPELIPLFETSSYVYNISAHFHTLVACDDGVYATGEGKGYKLGTENQEYVAGLTWISGLEGFDVRHVYAGNEHSIFATEEFKTVLACGRSNDGDQLGLGDRKAKIKRPRELNVEELVRVPLHLRSNVQGQEKTQRQTLLEEADGEDIPIVRGIVLGPEYTIVLCRLGIRLSKPDYERAKKEAKRAKSSKKQKKITVGTYVNDPKSNPMVKFAETEPMGDGSPRKKESGGGKRKKKASGWS